MFELHDDDDDDIAGCKVMLGFNRISWSCRCGLMVMNQGCKSTWLVQGKAVFVDAYFTGLFLDCSRKSWCHGLMQAGQGKFKAKVYVCKLV